MDDERDMIRARLDGQVEYDLYLEIKCLIKDIDIPGSVFSGAKKLSQIREWYRGEVIKRVLAMGDGACSVGSNLRYEMDTQMGVVPEDIRQEYIDKIDIGDGGD